MQATTAQVRRVSSELLRQQGGELFKAHYDEIARNKRVMQLRPDWQRYLALEEAGTLLCLGAFIGVGTHEPTCDPDEDCSCGAAPGVLVGYSVTFIAKHLHYSGLTYAQNDVLFVSQEHRKSRVGLELIYATEQAASAAGARLITWHAKQNTALERVLQHLHYGVHEVVFAKEL